MINKPFFKNQGKKTSTYIVLTKYNRNTHVIYNVHSVTGHVAFASIDNHIPLQPIL